MVKGGSAAVYHLEKYARWQFLAQSETEAQSIKAELKQTDVTNGKKHLSDHRLLRSYTTN